MARKSSSKSARRARRPAPRPRATPASAPKPFPGAAKLGDLSKMAKVLTPQQAFELYRANAKMALDVINAAIESTAKLRKLQFAGEEEARSMQQKAARHAAEASDAQSLMAAGQAVTQEAVEALGLRRFVELFGHMLLKALLLKFVRIVAGQHST